MNTSLPELPKQKKRNEAAFGITFRRWWETIRVPGTFELKDTRGKKSLPFSAVDPEQVSFGLAAESKGGVLARVTVGTTGTSDYIALIDTCAWVVVHYGRGEFYVITLQSFLWEKQHSKRRSLTALKANEISTYSSL